MYNPVKIDALLYCNLIHSPIGFGFCSACMVVIFKLLKMGNSKNLNKANIYETTIPSVCRHRTFVCCSSSRSIFFGFLFLYHVPQWHREEGSELALNSFFCFFYRRKKLPHILTNLDNILMNGRVNTMIYPLHNIRHKGSSMKQ
jgi:hypothetical protein